MQMDALQIVFSLIILIMSVVIHEVSHGYAAGLQGDPTAKLAGRLTLNPLKHLDLYGSLIVPVITYLLAGITFGWAKPVPYNPYNLRNQRWGELLVAIAGPLSNILIAVVFGMVVRFGIGSLPLSFINLSVLIVIINLGLAIFNLVPIPPLDGSKILYALIPGRYYQIRQTLERYSLIIILVFIFFLSQYLSIIVGFLFKVITGLGL
jgi:Zn-dependent protease